MKEMTRSLIIITMCTVLFIVHTYAAQNVKINFDYTYIYLFYKNMFIETYIWCK